MKKSIIYILFALFSFSAAVSLTACKDDGVEISDAYKSKTPKNVKLLEYGNKSLTICWDFVRGATSYTVQLVDGDMNPVSEALCMTTADIDYHEFTDLPTDRIYYGRVRANYPYSATSDWVYVTEHDKPAMLMASVGILDLDPQLKLHAASGSTLTFEWSYTDDKATDAARSYNVELFRDEACTDLYVSWLADGKLSSGKGIFTALAGYPVVRYTFSGLDPETTYYARITNLSFADIQTPVVAGPPAQAGPKAAANTPAKAGDIVLAQDFSAFIHGGDIVNSAAGYNAVSGTDFRKTWEKAEGVNPQADGDRPLCNWATEFHIHTGGTSAEYVEALGMKGWGSSGNTSTRQVRRRKRRHRHPLHAPADGPAREHDRQGQLLGQRLCRRRKRLRQRHRRRSRRRGGIRLEQRREQERHRLRVENGRHLVRRGQVRNLHRDARRTHPGVAHRLLLESGAGRHQQDALPARRHRRHLRGRNAS